MPPIELTYQPNECQRLVRHALPEGGIEIEIRTARRRLGRVARQTASADLGGFLLVPLVCATVWLLASRKPRAILRLTAAEFTIRERSDEFFGWFERTRTWSRRDLTDLRRNRFDPLLHVRVAGQERLDLLADVEPEVVEQVCELLEQAQRDVPPAG